MQIQPFLPRGGPSPEGDPSTRQTTQWGPLFGAERLSPQSGSSAPLKISFSLLRALLPQDVGLQAALHCTAGKPRQPPRAQTPAFLSSASCRPARRHPAQQAQCVFICARCRSAVFRYTCSSGYEFAQSDLQYRPRAMANNHYEGTNRLSHNMLMAAPVYPLPLSLCSRPHLVSNKCLS